MLAAIILILFYAGVIPRSIFVTTPIFDKTDKGEVEEKEMAQLKVGSKIVGKSIEIKNIQITNNPGKNKVLTDVDGKGNGVWMDIDKLIEESSTNYSNNRIFYILGIFLSAFLVIYFLKPRKVKPDSLKEENQDKVNLLNHKDK